MASKFWYPHARLNARGLRQPGLAAALPSFVGLPTAILIDSPDFDRIAGLIY